ncbi:MAG: ligase-associated DNA damage response endonuclease PdeM [Phycisphaerales bacterium]|nr:ligase-associated DNA damage response endonuclease PdeM [Phycisphaerales bacterium]
MHHTTIQLAGETLALLPAPAAWWATQRTLFVADIHLGKAEAFRTSGVAAPNACTAHDLNRLASLVETAGARRLVILGDLLHAKAGVTQAAADAFTAFAERTGPIETLLVRGNHDHAAGDPPAPWITCVDAPFALGPFTLMHEPPEDGTPTEGLLCGHIHPVVSLTSNFSRMRAACFWLTRGALVLPAFGVFTGGRRINAKEGDRVFAVGPDRVTEAPIATTPRHKAPSRTT